jgi:Flp pilus assembly protein TadG
MIARLRASIASDTRGAAAIEFALCAPVLLIGMMGLFDMGHNMYTASVIQGAVQKVARDSTIEGADDRGAALDQKVTDMVRQIAPGATIQFERTSYATFSDVGRPEDWNDVNGNGVCDAGEAFEDANGNGSWDADMGRSGFGGARDAVLYEVSVTYVRPFPVSKLIG